MSDDEETFEDFCDDIIVHDDVVDGDLDFTFTELKEEEKKMCSKCGFWFTIRNLEDGGMCSRCAHLVRLNHEWRAWAEEETANEKLSKHFVSFSNDLVTYIPRNILKKAESIIKEDEVPITLTTTTVITLVTKGEDSNQKTQLIATTAETITIPDNTASTTATTTEQLNTTWSPPTQSLIASD